MKHCGKLVEVILYLASGQKGLGYCTSMDLETLYRKADKYCIEKFHCNLTRDFPYLNGTEKQDKLFIKKNLEQYLDLGIETLRLVLQVSNTMRQKAGDTLAFTIAKPYLGNYPLVIPNRLVNRDHLSQSDIESLDFALDKKEKK
jgi:hypothetical protein